MITESPGRIRAAPRWSSAVVPWDSLSSFSLSGNVRTAYSSCQRVRSDSIADSSVLPTITAVIVHSNACKSVIVVSSLYHCLPESQAKSFSRPSRLMSAPVISSRPSLPHLLPSHNHPSHIPARYPQAVSGRSEIPSSHISQSYHN